jgi:CheY-like chemotaxis protein
VLVLDDEPGIGRVVQRSLAADHDVTSVTEARAALDQIAGGERFDVILCDLMMPVVTGMDFLLELERTVPEQARAVIFLTGGVFTAKVAEFMDRVKNPRIDKPFDPQMLRKIVRQRVAERPA